MREKLYQKSVKTDKKGRKIDKQWIKVVLDGHNFAFWLGNFRLDVYFIRLNKKVWWKEIEKK